MKNICFKIHMVVLNFFVFLAMSAPLAFADAIVEPVFCDPSSVSLDSIVYTPGFADGYTGYGTNGLLSTSYDATSCVGLFVKLDDYPQNHNEDPDSSPDPNIGEEGDGLLNGGGKTYIGPDGESYFSGLEFITEADLQDIDGDGNATDPGWIHLANIQVNDDNSSSTEYDTSGPHPYQTIIDQDTGEELVLDIGDLLTIELDFDTGDWTLTTKLDVIDKAQALLGEATFDHLAFSFKSSTGFAVYDFNFKEIFAIENNPLLNFLTPYELSGSFDAEDFNFKDFSHVNIWARDPNDVNVVPEPGTMLLLGFGLVGLGLYVRRK